MRILVLQLARFGDIYQTWPTLNALRRTHPEAELHVLVRERFRRALDGLDFVTAHVLPTSRILEPAWVNGDEGLSLERLSQTLAPLVALDFTRVINLSFSPFSSFITDYLGSKSTVSGYTRFSDGYFNPVDDFSAYFFAQVGVDRANRYHLTDVFAGVAGVELSDSDFEASRPSGARRGIVLHLGASHVEKTYPPELWAETLKELRRLTNEPITLIGSADERPLATGVAAGANVDRVHNLTGETSLAELFDVIAGARVLVGADSAPVQMANLTATPTLNLSGDAVNFWETGPVTAGSRVLVAGRVADLEPRQIVAEILAMHQNLPPTGPCAERTSRAEPYVLRGMEQDDFAWRLIEALYTGAPYPTTESSLDLAAFGRLFESADLALTELERWNGPDRANAAERLAVIDDILPTIVKMNPRVEPLVQWFQTERLRLGPMPAADVLKRTAQLFADLRTIAMVYLGPADRGTDRERVIELGRAIAPSLREYDFAAVEGPFSDLLQDLEGFNDPTNVRSAHWSAWLKSLGDALAARDFIELADRLEHELPIEVRRLTEDVLPFKS